MSAAPALEWYFKQDYSRAGRFELPQIQNQQINLDDLKLIRFSEIVKGETKDLDATVHFFEPDDRFDEVWRKPDNYLGELGQYRQVMTPDFSLYLDTPMSLQLVNTFRTRWCGWYWQHNGLTVIPSVNWSHEGSFEFCFDGLPRDATLAVSTVGVHNNESGFMTGYAEMCRRLNPQAVICYGEPFEAMTDVANLITVPYSRTTRTTSRR